MSNPVIHWTGGVNHLGGVALSGYPCCCSGRRCIDIAKDPSRCSKEPGKVTCRLCLRLMAADASIVLPGRYRSTARRPSIALTPEGYDALDRAAKRLGLSMAATIAKLTEDVR